MKPSDIENLTQPRKAYWPRVRRVTALLMLLWFFATFGIIFFARELSNFTLFGWPFSFYMAAQGLTLMYVAIVAVYAMLMRRLDKSFKDETTDAHDS
jgi:putative solute:sodium symporter small subunit